MGPYLTSGDCFLNPSSLPYVHFLPYIVSNVQLSSSSSQEIALVLYTFTSSRKGLLYDGAAKEMSMVASTTMNTAILHPTRRVSDHPPNLTGIDESAKFLRNRSSSSIRTVAQLIPSFVGLGPKFHDAKSKKNPPILSTRSLRNTIL